jgi:predicted NUDIX family NTP pyrophosphohydrolase
LFVAAKREFEEELGFEPTGDIVQFLPVKQKAGEVVHAWAFEDERPICLDEDTRYHDLRTDVRQQGNAGRHKHADG